MTGKIVQLTVLVAIWILRQKRLLTTTIEGVTTFQHIIHHLETRRPVVASISSANFLAPDE